MSVCATLFSKAKTMLICFSIALERIQKIFDKETKKDRLKLETVHVHIYVFL